MCGRVHGAVLVNVVAGGQVFCKHDSFGVAEFDIVPLIGVDDGKLAPRVPPHHEIDRGGGSNYQAAAHAPQRDGGVLAVARLAAERTRAELPTTAVRVIVLPVVWVRATSYRRRVASSAMV